MFELKKISLLQNLSRWLLLISLFMVVVSIAGAGGGLQDRQFLPNFENNYVKIKVVLDKDSNYRAAIFCHRYYYNLDEQQGLYVIIQDKKGNDIVSLKRVVGQTSFDYSKLRHFSDYAALIKKMKETQYRPGALKYTAMFKVSESKEYIITSNILQLAAKGCGYQSFFLISRANDIWFLIGKIFALYIFIGFWLLEIFFLFKRLR